MKTTTRSSFLRIFTLRLVGPLVLLSSSAAPGQSLETLSLGSTADQPRPAASRSSDAAARRYVVGPDDVLEVAYWRDKDMSAQVVVRPDGRISLPLLGEIEAAGLTPQQLTERIATLAGGVLEAPIPIVSIKQINSRKVFITGEVARPGPYPLIGPTTVVQLIAMAGGLGEFADQKRIVIMRTNEGTTQTFPFNYKEVSRLKKLEMNILLMPGDTVLVP